MLIALATAIALSQTTAPQPVTELVSSVKTIAPGKPFTVGLHMKLPAGWHNYYSNPGESGVPTTITWSMPAGYMAGPIQWPLPKRIVIGGIPMYGYEGDLWLTSTITPAPKAKLGPLVLNAKADWLLCAETCIPQNASFQLKLKVGRSSVGTSNPGLTAAIKALPKHALPWSIAAITAGKAVRLTVQDPVKDSSDITFFPADPESFTADAPQFSTVAHGFQIVVPLSRYATKPPKRLIGILSFPEQGKSYWVDTPVTS